MKRNPKNITTSKKEMGPKLKIFFKKKADKLKHTQLTCPFCREVLQGISAFGSHLKKHCT